jgi:hypothetical protein
VPKIKPPIGIMPRHIWEAQRLDELRGAIYRYFHANLQISPEWIEEYNELLKKRRRESDE